MRTYQVRYYKTDGEIFLLKLAKLTDYAVIVLAEMAGARQVVAASALAERTRLPEPTVAKILKQLAGAAIISSVRGVNGGYRLDIDPASLPVTAIIAAIEGPVALTACVESSVDKCERAGNCFMQGRWNKVNQAVHEALDKVSLADMMPEKTSSELVERIA